MILLETTAMKVAQLVLLCCVFISAAQSSGETVDISVASGTPLDLAGYTEGDNLTLRCEVTGLGTSSLDYVVSWQHGVEVISSDTALKEPYNSPRFAVELSPLAGRGDTTHDLAYDLTISPVRRGDDGEYSCLIETQVPGNPMSLNVVAVQTVSLSVLYFPNQTSPTCQPDGPMDVMEGKPVLLRCSSEKGNPEVELTLSNIRTNPWSTIQDRDTISQELLINYVTPSSDGLIFICTIESTAFPALGRSCQLGPLKVIPSVVNPTIGFATQGPNNPILPGSDRPTLSPPTNAACLGWFIGFLVATGIATLSIVIIIALVASRRMQEDREKMKRRKVQGLSLNDASKEGTRVTDAEEGAYTNVAVTAD